MITGRFIAARRCALRRADRGKANQPRAVRLSTAGHLKQFGNQQLITRGEVG
jgi:hypothetical protein